MAYNGYGGYSPYFQSQSTEQNGRTQYPYQTSSGDNTGSHQRYNYAAPDSAPSNSQQHGQALTQNQTNYTQNPYAPAGYQNPHRNSSNTRATGDTALGNLAYASTLRQTPGNPIQRAADYNKQNIVYDQSQGHGQNQVVQRSDSRGAISTMSSNSLNPNVSTQSQPGHPAYSQQNQYNAYGTNHYGGSAQTRRSSQQAAPPSRPASGQGMHMVNQHRQSTHSPRPSNFPNTQQHSTHRAAGTSDAPISRPSSTQMHTQRASDSHPRPTPQTNRENAALSSHKQAESGTSKTSAVQRPSNTQFTQLPSIANVTNPQNHESNNATQRPTTVDPNQIFNHYEYQKRQAAIAAEAEAAKKKAAEEAEEARKKTEAAKQIQQLSQANELNGTSEEARKEEMEAEMRLMLEKMRDYKSKDPTLFSQIWEQVKKAQPPVSSKDAAQPSTELPASREVALPSPVTHVPASNRHSDLSSTKSLQTSPQADGEGLPDRGKFPAARRGRPGRRSRGGRTLPLPAHEQPAPVSHDITDQLHVDAPNAPDPNSQLAGSVDAPVLASTSKEPPQKVWVSGKQPQASQKKSPKARMSSQPKPPSAPVEQQAPPRPSGQTLWPEKDKWTLAIAARDTLLLNPVNAGKTITPEEVHRILNEGPSYEELCKILEAKGFVVERTPFAQRLLSAVPRLQTSQSRPPGPVSSFASHSHPPHVQPSHSHPSRVQPPRSQPSTSGNVAPMAPMFGVLQPISGPYTPGSSPQVNGHSVTATVSHSNDRPTSEETQPSQMYSSFQLNGYSSSPLQQPEVPAQQSVSKQQAARKRDFAEIVDLTAENAEDEELARQRDEQLRKIKQMQQVKAAMDAAMAKKSTELPPVTQKPKGIHLSPGVGLSSSAPSEDDAAGSARHKNATSRKARKSKDVVKSIKKVDALRRSSYDERTIARDILIATGKHPTMSALNYHLDPLRDRFRHVDYQSDLSTFDWASVDPGGRPVKARYVEDSEQVSRPDDVNDADDEDAGPDVVASGPRKVRQAVTNATGDTIMSDVSPPGPVKGFFSSPPSIRGRGRPFGRGPRPTRGGMNSRPSLSAGSPSQHASPPTQTFATPTRLINMDNRGDVSMLAAGISAPITNVSASRPALSTPLEGESSGTVQLSPATSEKKRRGRPPKSQTPSTIVPTISTPQSSSGPPLLDAAPPSIQKPLVSKVPASVMPEPRVASYQRTTTPARPSGLRNQIPLTSPFAVVIPQRSPSVVELSESSQPRKSKKVKRSPPPKFQVYRCRWKDCKGELHNLETLRKHVRNHIDELDGDLKCLWSGCGTTKIAGISTDASALQPLSFKSETAWERHMDGRHLDHYAWELGDGPSTHPSDAEASDYLSDNQGRQATPIARPDSSRSDSFNLATVPRDERAKVAKAFHAAHENKTEAQKAQAVFDNRVERRRKLGPGIERAGHQFVTDAKRALLDLSDEGELRKVDEADL